MQKATSEMLTMVSIFRKLLSHKRKWCRLGCGSGFSLVELMVAVAIIGILSAIAIPLVLSWLPDIRLRGAARDLYGVIMKTKGEAIKRNSNCTLVFNQVIGGTTFAYVLFEDRDSDLEFDAFPAEPIIVQQEQWPQNVLLGANGVSLGAGNITFGANDDGNPAITFRPNSIPTGNGGGFINGSVFFTNTNGRNISVIVNQSGNVRIN